LTLLGRRVAVAIPDTVLEEKESPREKTAKLGLVARACAIYGVDVIEVFRDSKGRGEGAEICKVLEYLETPQYLRRRLYPLDESLKYAGILPPLRIPSHKAKVPVGSLAVGELREGVTNRDGTVDVGLDLAPRLSRRVPPGERVTVKIVSVKPLIAEQIPREMIDGYWGYKVEEQKSMNILDDKGFKIRIAT
jgi:predicted SPOUT superfamily RNA methylase MTH1